MAAPRRYKRINLDADGTLLDLAQPSSVIEFEFAPNLPAGLAHRNSGVNPMDLKAIQQSLQRSGCDAWLFYDHHYRDPIAYRILGLEPAVWSRRWYYLIPASGEPEKLAHRIEPGSLAELPGRENAYSSWKEQRERLGAMVAGKTRVAMQYSPLNDIPYIGLVDAGTVELVRGFGVDIVSSADLVQLFEARWTPEALSSHLEAGEAVHRIIRQAFGMIREAVKRGKPLDEYRLQQEILKLFEQNGLEADHPSIVAANRHTADPHYSPGASGSLPLGKGDFVLLDVWARRKTPEAVYFDVTWTGFVGEEIPKRHSDIFEIVREARDAGIEITRSRLRSGETVRGCDVDDEVRAIIERHGYGEFFIHRTGHSIGREVHGNGANLDNFETHDARPLIPRTCFSVEPGIYLPEFGVRSEVDVYVDEREARVTGEAQQAIVPILAASF
ncbi:MAG: M24 family metallopeptidase [Terriglobia bacterium]